MSQVREGLRPHWGVWTLLGHGELLKVFEQKRAKLIGCSRKTNNGEELSCVEASILSLQKGNKPSENSVILQKLLLPCICHCFSSLK